MRTEIRNICLACCLLVVSACNKHIGLMVEPGAGVEFDGHYYPSVVFENGQEWLTENLRTAIYADGDSIPNITDDPEWGNLTSDAWSHYNNDVYYENIYGKLYNWYAVSGPKNLCPDGWHVANYPDWFQLAGYLGGSETAGGLMKSTGTEYWEGPNTDATNESGFNGLPGGYRSLFGSVFRGTEAHWWVASSNGNNGWTAALYNTSGSLWFDPISPQYGCSVRCIRGTVAGSLESIDCGEATLTGDLTAGAVANGVICNVPYSYGNGGIHEGEVITSTGVTGLTATLQAGNFSTGYGVLTYAITGTPAGGGIASFTLNIGEQSCTVEVPIAIESVAGDVVNFQGHAYATVVLGNGQQWMTENLRTSAYANGDPIPNVTDYTEWENLTSGAYSHYENISALDNGWGKLYNWYAVADPRNLCPVGWHVPSETDWNELIKYLDYSYESNDVESAIAGGKMKTTETGYWLSPNTSATNESGFSGWPGGYRYLAGNFWTMGEYGYWWSSTSAVSAEAYLRYLRYNSGAVNTGIDSKQSGLSIRCIKD